jgi:hypothetical protein
MMQFYSGPLMHFLSGVDTRHIGSEDRRKTARRPCRGRRMYVLGPPCSFLRETDAAQTLA